MKSKLLIFGATGKLASCVCGILSHSFDLIRFSSKKCTSPNSGSTLIEYDINKGNRESRIKVLDNIFDSHDRIVGAIFFSGGSLPTLPVDDVKRRKSVFQLNVESAFEPIDYILTIGLLMPLKFIVISSTAVSERAVGDDYSSAKVYLEDLFKRYARRYAATNFSFSCLRLGYVATPDRFHERLKHEDYISYIEFLVKFHPNLVPLSCDEVMAALVFILSAPPHVSNGLFLNLSGGNL